MDLLVSDISGWARIRVLREHVPLQTIDKEGLGTNGPGLYQKSLNGLKARVGGSRGYVSLLTFMRDILGLCVPLIFRKVKCNNILY